MSEPRVVASIPKNSRDEIKVSLNTFAGQRLVDVRIYSEIDGVVRPTKKGISLARERLPDLIRALQQAEREAGR